jgi:hypothetical protein
VISNSQVGWNVSGNWNRTTKVGWDNDVYENCVWASARVPDYDQNGGIDPTELGFDAYDNLIVEPTYSNRETEDFEVGGDDPCEAVIEATCCREQMLISCLCSNIPCWLAILGASSFSKILNWGRLTGTSK